MLQVRVLQLARRLTKFNMMRTWKESTEDDVYYVYVAPGFIRFTDDYAEAKAFAAKHGKEVQQTRA